MGCGSSKLAPHKPSGRAGECQGHKRGTGDLGHLSHIKYCHACKRHPVCRGCQKVLGSRAAAHRALSESQARWAAKAEQERRARMRR